MKFGCNRPSSFREVVWNCGRRTTEPAYTISSPGAFGSGELKWHLRSSRGLFRTCYTRYFILQWYRA